MSQPVSPPISPISGPSKPGEFALTVCWLFVILALVLSAVGFYRMYSYDELSDKIVGGDAYNYIVLATRGVGYLVAGCTSAVIAAIAAVFSGVARLSAL